jgi:peptidoglycan/xylan/chitin deacetylase (PgdA/CDA1 family)
MGTDLLARQSDHSTETRQIIVTCAGRMKGIHIEAIAVMATAFPSWSFHVLSARTTHLGPDWTGQRSRSRAAPSQREDLRDPIDALRFANVHRLGPHDREPAANLKPSGASPPWLVVHLDGDNPSVAMLESPGLGSITFRESDLAPSEAKRNRDGGSPAADQDTAFHVVFRDARTDVEHVIHSTELRIPRFSTPTGLRAQLELIASRALVQALATLRDWAASGATDTPPPQIRLSDNLAIPETSQATTLAQPSAPSHRLTGFVKYQLLRAYVNLYAPIRNAWRSLLGRNRVTVLVYHRVSDNYRDTVTVGVEQFINHLACMRRHYQVIELADFLQNRGRPRGRPAVVITFDDGYADNELAAMLLRRAGLPCTFFISTRIVGTDQAFPHDLRRLGHCVPALDWPTVRAMASSGFSIANHTANHADLGSVPQIEAEREILDAQDDLTRELPGLSRPDWLAFPYGGPSNITESLRSRLGRLGIEACLSAHGGTNPTDFDPLDIRRQGVDSRMDCLRLRASIEGWSWRR